MNNKDSYPAPREKIDQLIRNKETLKGQRFKSAEAQRVYDNLDFGDKVENKPITTTKYDKKILGYEIININNYINQRIWPRSIYTTDKLVRLAMSAKLEFLKRYLSKKRHVPMNMIWILLIIMIIVIGVAVFLFVLPKLGVI